MKKTQATIKRLQKPPEGSAPPMFKSRSQREKYDRHCAAGGRTFADLDMRDRHHRPDVLTDIMIEAWKRIYTHIYIIEQTAEGTTHTTTLTPPLITVVQDYVDRLKVAFPILADKAYEGNRLQTTGTQAGRPMLLTGEIPEPFIRGAQIGIFTLDFCCGDVPFSVFVALCPRNHFVLPVVAPVFHSGFTTLLAALVKLFAPYAPLSVKLLDPAVCHRSDKVLEFLEKVNEQFRREKTTTSPFFMISEMESFFEDPSYASELRSVTEISRSAVTSFVSQTIEAVALRAKITPNDVFSTKDSRSLQCALMRWALLYAAEGMRRSKKNAADGARY